MESIYKSKEYVRSSDDESESDKPIKRRGKMQWRKSCERDDQSDDDYEPSIKLLKEEIDSELIPYASLSKAPRKMSSQFKVTIKPRNYENELTRDDFFNTLVDMYKNLELIVSREDYPSYSQSRYRSKKYFKIYIDFSATDYRKLTSNNVFTIIFNILRSKVGEEPKILEEKKNISVFDRTPEIMIENVSNKKRAIVWATNEFLPRFTENFEPESEFSESFRINHWAVANKDNKFAMETPFVTESRISSIKLKCLLDDVRNKYHVKCELKKCELGPFGDWRDEVIKWWNSWVINGWHHKKPQLLLISPPNCGKTVFIREVLFREGQVDAIPNEAILIPERAGSGYHISQFAWSKANPCVHVVVFCDEYDIRHYNTELLKNILQGSPFAQSIKYKTSDDISLRMPMIFATNKKLPKNEETIGLEERFRLIEISKNFVPFHPSTKSPYAQMFKDFYKNEKIKQINNECTASKSKVSQEFIDMFNDEEFQKTFLESSQQENKKEVNKKVEQDFYKVICDSMDSINLSQSK